MRAAWLALTVWSMAMMAGAPSWAQMPPGPPPSQGGPLGNADGAGGVVAGPPAAHVKIAACDEPTLGRVIASGGVTVTVNPATRWQPRAGEVLVAVKADAQVLKGFTLRACMGWLPGDPSAWFSADRLKSLRLAGVHLRPSDTGGLINAGVIVPALGDSPAGILSRWWSSEWPSTGLGLVPVAAVRLIGYNDSGLLFDTVCPIGVTSITWSLFVTAASIALTMFVLHRLALSLVPANARPVAGAGVGVRLAARHVLGGNWILWLVRGADGRASLTSLQILLWSVVIAGGSIYVMALSGNLLDLTPGTLVLLGISGAAKVVAITRDPNAPAAANPDRRPMWRDLLCETDDGGTDGTRLQMLVFTVVSAAFVTLQVLNTFVIPDIPSGYQILMGISNGVYAGRKLTGGGRQA